MKKILAAVFACGISCLSLWSQTFCSSDNFDKSKYQDVIYPCNAETIWEKTGNDKFSYATEIWKERQEGSTKILLMNSGDPIGEEMFWYGKKLPESILPFTDSSERKAVRAYFRLQKDYMTDEWSYVIDALEILDHKFFTFYYYRCDSNLWLRSRSSTSGEKIKLLQKNTDLRITEVGPAQTIDGISSFWVKVKVYRSDSDFDTGWCFGGYLICIGP